MIITWDILQHTREMGVVTSSGWISGSPRNGLSSSKVQATFFDERKSDVDESLASSFLFPKLLAEEVAESGALSSADCVPKTRKEYCEARSSR